MVTSVVYIVQVSLGFILYHVMSLHVLADGHIIAESCSHCQEHFIPNTVTVVNISFLIVLVAYTELSS